MLCALILDTMLSARRRVLAEPWREVIGYFVATSLSRFWPKCMVGGRSCPLRLNVGWWGARAPVRSSAHYFDPFKFVIHTQLIGKEQKPIRAE